MQPNQYQRRHLHLLRYPSRSHLSHRDATHGWPLNYYPYSARYTYWLDAAGGTLGLYIDWLREGGDPLSRAGQQYLCRPGDLSVLMKIQNSHLACTVGGWKSVRKCLSFGRFVTSRRLTFTEAVVLSVQIGYNNRNSISPCFVSWLVGSSVVTHVWLSLLDGVMLESFASCTALSSSVEWSDILHCCSRAVNICQQPRRRHWYVLYFHWATGLSYRFEIAGVRVVFARTFVLPPTIPFRKQRRIP